MVTVIIPPNFAYDVDYWLNAKLVMYSFSLIESMNHDDLYNYITN